jgi:hypothetical protein
MARKAGIIMSESKDKKETQKKLNRAQVIKELEAIARKVGIIKKIDWARPISKADIQYILDRWPFLEIKNPDADQEDKEAEVEFFTAMSGWLIHDYGDVIASSPGMFLFGGGYYYVDWGDDDEGSEAGPLITRGIVNPKKGTIINQMFLTGMDMVNLAIHRQWKTIQIVDGHPRMKWAAWIQARKYSLKVVGYKPTEKEIKKALLLEKTREEMDKLLRKKQGRVSDAQRLER